MAAAFRSITSLSGATRTNSTLTAPSGLSNDDILVLILYMENNITPTPPTGFAQWSQANNSTIDTWIWWKRASGESGSYTTTHASAWTEGALLAVSGATTSGTPEDPAPSANTGNSTTITATGITTTLNDDLIIFVGASFTTGSYTPPTGTTPTFTERYDGAGDLNVDTGGWASHGATGNKTQTSSGNEWTGQLVSVKVASAATDTQEWQFYAPPRLVRVTNTSY